MALENGRLTKKQKKANAFRDRKGKKKEEVLDVPEEDGQESTELGVEAMDVLRAEEKPKKKGKKAVAVLDVSADGSASPAAPSKKRKREAVEVEGTIPAEAGMVGGVQKKKKKKKASDGDEGQDNAESTDKARRLILFVGNLRYVTSREAILEHFSACDPPPTVRLLTPKQSKPGATVTKSKGCAFLEFTSKSSLQQALKLHHSELDGRKINVELTAGGGGKGDGRLAKLQKRNKELNTQRAKRLKQSSNGEDVEIRSQRFSTTSGEGDAPRAKHTWTVGDTVDEETHRGGKNVKKRGKRKPKDMGTGVNAIPVG